MVRRAASTKSGKRSFRAAFRRAVAAILLAITGLYAICALSLLALRFIRPLTTAVQVQRRVESWFASGKYQKRYSYVPLSSVSPHLQHAVIAAEDGRFFHHHGIDWQETWRVLDDDLDRGRISRGASTITQQLVKNLFLTTRRSWLRKGVEFTLVPIAELTLGKRRILELYLNIIEWGPGIWGAEAAARYHYHTTASRLTREQAARLAACLPAPLTRWPGRMDRYSALILERMRTMGW